MKRVVIDTSVWVSALIRKEGSSRKVIAAALKNEVIPQMDTALFLEYEAVMKREKIRALCPLSTEERGELFAAFLSTARWNEVYYLWRPNLPDENDNFLVELAVASNAEAIVTRNITDFKAAELCFPFKVIDPEAFVEGDGL